MSESFAELFEESLSKSEMKPGSIIMGTVVDITGDFVIVNAGLKSEGAVPIEEFAAEGGEPDVNIGDTVEVALDSVEDGFGETKLSREKARRARSWTVLEQALADDEIIKGNITGKVKVASQLKCAISARSCLVHWSMFGLCVIPVILKAKSLSSR